MGTIEYTSLETLKRSEKAIVEVAMLDDYPDRVIVKHLKGVNMHLFHQISYLHSVYIPKIHKCELDGEWLVVVEEYLEGENLEQYLRSHRLTDKQKLDIAVQLCEAVKCLHALHPPIIHRDIKPHNIIINEHGALKLIDFDASRYYREDDNRQDTRLLGTPEYAPPEQYGYSQTDVRSDIYSVGMVFEELKLTEKNFLAARWEKIVGKCRNFDPKHRYQTVEELGKEVKKMVFLRTVTGRTVLSWSIALLLLLIVVWQGCMLGRNSRETSENRDVVTGMPSPTEILQETSTPAPTETPTPEPTATSTPVPEQNQSETEEEKELGKALEETTRVYHYYCDREDTQGLYFCSNLAMIEELTLTKVEFYEYMTGTMIAVPREMLSKEYGYVVISNEFLSALQHTYYEVYVYFYDEQIGGHTHREVFGIHDKLQGEVKEAVLANGNHSFYRPYPTDYVGLVANAHTTKITGLYLDKYNFGTERVLWETAFLEQIEESNYQISEDGRWIRVDKRLFEEYSQRDLLYLYVACDDGSYQPVKVEYYYENPGWMPE